MSTELQPPVSARSDLQQQPWARGLPRRTFQGVVARGVTSEEAFLAMDPKGLGSAHEMYVSTVQASVRHNRNFPPGALLPESYARRCLEYGGVAYRHDKPVASLGTRGLDLGVFIRVRLGSVFLAKYKPGSFLTYSGDNLLRPASSVSRYGFYRNGKLGLTETREIFGMEHDALARFLSAFHGLTTCSFRSRISCSYRPNRCDMSGGYIPGHFPMICLAASGTHGNHVSLEAFYRLLGTMAAYRPESPLGISLSRRGVTDEDWLLLQATRLAKRGWQCSELDADRWNGLMG